MPRPEQMDILGFPAFVFITIVAGLLLAGRELSKFILIILLLVGVIGAIVDGVIVYKNFIAKGK